MTEHSFYADNLVDALLEEGVEVQQIWELDGWKENEQGYYWTDIFTGKHNGYDGVANGHLNHHTASAAYTPYVKNSRGQTKATGWLGIRDGGRLYQNRATGVPTIALASAGPADYSAGSGVRDYIKKLHASEAALKQMSGDDDPKFYGNRFVLNTEIVCDGVGGSIDQDSWDLLILYNAALANLHDADEHWNGFHAGFTRRKIDFRDGRYRNAVQTTEQMWQEVSMVLTGQVVIPPVEPPIDPPTPGDLTYLPLIYRDGYSEADGKRPAVMAWQGVCKGLGHPDDNSTADDKIDGQFGRGTERSTKLVQQDLGRQETGVADPVTRALAERLLLP